MCLTHGASRRSLGGPEQCHGGRHRSEDGTRASGVPKWSTLSPEWRKAFVEPLKKAVGVYLDHAGIKGVAQGRVVEPTKS